MTSKFCTQIIVHSSQGIAGHFPFLHFLPLCNLVPHFPFPHFPHPAFSLCRIFFFSHFQSPRQRSVGSEDRVETNGRTDRRMDVITLPCSLMRSAKMRGSQSSIHQRPRSRADLARKRTRIMDWIRERLRQRNVIHVATYGLRATACTNLQNRRMAQGTYAPVSYTHLTLPTNREV